jgi:cell division protein FtsX
MGKMLVLGVNVGGLGTLIASMASVISFKLYNNSEEAKAPGGKSFFGVFTIYNLALLVILGLLVFLPAAL